MENCRAMRPAAVVQLKATRNLRWCQVRGCTANADCSASLRHQNRNTCVEASVLQRMTIVPSDQPLTISPPLTCSTCPVTYEASLDARNT